MRSRLTTASGALAPGARRTAVAGRLRDQAQARLADYRSLAWREESEGRMLGHVAGQLAAQQLAAAGAEPRALTVTVQPARGVGPAEGREVRVASRHAYRARAASFEFKPDTLHQFLAKAVSQR